MACCIYIQSLTFFILPPSLPPFLPPSLPPSLRRTGGGGGNSTSYTYSDGGREGGREGGRDGVIEDSSPFSPENSGPLLHHAVGEDDVFVGQGREGGREGGEGESGGGIHLNHTTTNPFLSPSVPPSLPP